jgi:hypothetical protein
MEERGITEDEVETAIRRQFGHFQAGTRPGTLKCVGNAGPRTLEVVVAAADREFVVSVWEVR